jgi:pimeloyl-ACP methyl ester carboxylesterase
MEPKTRYARSGDVRLAYQIVGDGPFDLAFIPGWVSHVEHFWEVPASARFFRRLASFSRLILFDKRGTGCSASVTRALTLEQRMDDLRAVMDAAGSERAAVCGISEGGPMSLLFAATYPGLATHLVVYGSGPRFRWASDYPCGIDNEAVRSVVERVEQQWGEGAFLSLMAPSHAEDGRATQQFARYERLGARPGMALALVRLALEINVRDILPAIHVPTLILHRAGDPAATVEGARYMAERIPDARYRELPGAEHLPWIGGADALVDEIEEFLTGTQHGPEPAQILATVLCMDIAGSTEQATKLGDRQWQELLDRYHVLVRRELQRFRGREVQVTGDGFLATFDRPAAGIRCACTINDAVRALGSEIRAGLHTGECEVRGDGIGGIGVHIGARVAAQAGRGEVLVSRTVKDLAAGSGIEFADRGSQVLTGVPGEWQLFAVER